MTKNVESLTKRILHALQTESLESDLESILPNINLLRQKIETRHRQKVWDCRTSTRATETLHQHRRVQPLI